MMLRLLGEAGDGVDKIHRGGKILELEGAGDHLAAAFPLRQRGQRGIDSCFIQFHASGGKAFR